MRSAVAPRPAPAATRPVLVEPDDGGMIESEAFRSPRLHVPSLLAGDAAGVLAGLESGAARGQP